MSSPGVPLPRPRLTSGDDEAFFPDEWGTLLPSGLHQNKFATSGKVATDTFRNPLFHSSVTTPELTPKEIKALDAVGPGAHLDRYWMYVPPAFRAQHAKITAFFGVGTEMMRHGMRTFFELTTDRILVIIPGIELWPSIKRSVGRTFGVGLEDGIVNSLLARAGTRVASWSVDIMACYSTGYRGFNGTINNFATVSRGLDLSKVSTMIVYDALYQGNEPPPDHSGRNTKAALKTMNTVTGSTVRLGVYEVTPGGTPRGRGDTRVPQSWLKATFGSRYGLSNLKRHAPALQALIFARMFDAAVKDGYLPAASLPQPLRNLMAALPKRGTVHSPLKPFTFRRFPTSFTALTDWATTNATDISGASRHLEKLRKDFVSHPSFRLMGWFPRDIGEIMHDGFIPEFGGELLAI